MDNGTLVTIFIPALIARLWQHEQAKGSPLTAEKVTAICERAICMTLRRDLAREIIAERGFADIDPANAWEEWQVARSPPEKVVEPYAETKIAAAGV
jgi:hypothetical protein